MSHPIRGHRVVPLPVAPTMAIDENGVPRVVLTEAPRMATMAENNANIPRPALTAPDVAPNYVPHVPEVPPANITVQPALIQDPDPDENHTPEQPDEELSTDEPSSMDDLDTAAVELYNVIGDTESLAPFAEALQGYIAAQVQHAQALTDAVRIVGQQQQWLVDTVGPAMGQVTAVMSGGGGPLGAMLRKMTGMKGGVGNGGNPTGDPGVPAGQSAGQ